MSERIKTPCIGVCSTVFGDVVCRGCKRFVHEVIDWNVYSVEQKILVKERIAQLSTQVLNNKLRVNDEALFAALVKKVGVDNKLSQALKVLEVLRKAAKQIDSLEAFGIEAFPEYQSYSTNELKEIIDAEIYLLASATYQMNFKPQTGNVNQTGKSDETYVQANELERIQLTNSNSEVQFK